jgi:hypothetical protein
VKIKFNTIDQLYSKLVELRLTNELIGRYDDQAILRELKIRGIPEDILKPFRDYLSEPVPDREMLKKWESNVC